MNAYITTHGRGFFARDEELTHLSTYCPCTAKKNTLAFEASNYSLPFTRVQAH